MVEESHILTAFAWRGLFSKAIHFLLFLSLLLLLLLLSPPKFRSIDQSLTTIEEAIQNSLPTQQ
jgi:hypothetical protein